MGSQAENQLIMAMIAGTDVEHAAIVRPGDFRDPKAAAIWEAGWNVRDLGKPVTLLALEHELKSLGKWDFVGQANAFNAFETANVSSWYSPHEIADAAAAIKRDSQLRNILRISGEMADAARRDLADVGQIIADFSGRLASCAPGLDDEDTVTLGAAMAQRLEQARQEARGEQERRRVPTGLRGLDDALRGGFRPTWMVVLGGAPKMGKSGLAMHFARSAARTGHPVLAFSQEMSRLELAERSLAAESDVPIASIDNGPRDAEWADLIRVTEAWSRRYFKIVDKPVDWSRLVSIARRWSRDQRGKHGMIVIDYVQLVRGERRPGGNREQEIAAMSRGAKNLAVELEQTVLVLSQFSRKIEDREDKRPRKSDLRESGALESDANLVLGIHRPWVYDTTHPAAHAEIHILANRHGPFPMVVDAVFAPATTSFGDRYDHR
jgi:replicative DNA helicase